MFRSTIKVVSVKSLLMKKNKTIERTYSTLGGAVSCIGMLDTDRKDVKNLFRYQIPMPKLFYQTGNHK